MKKILLIAALLPTLMLAQDGEYNKWSIELDAGVTKPFRTNTPGFIGETPEFLAANLGVRYMITTKFGLKADFGYYEFDNKDTSPNFESKYYRGSLQGVANLGTVLGLRESKLKNFGILLHGGAGLSMLNFEAPRNDTEWLVNLIVGVTPQLKLSDRITLQGDVSLIGNLSQDYNWDGVSRSERQFFDGGILNATLGLAFNLGKNSVHADWTDSNPLKKEVEELKARVANIETDLLDTDQDGVPDYLDREPNTTSGVTVNTKGVTVDNNRNGIPDELETALDREFEAIKADMPKADSYDAIKKLLHDGYVNVYFNTASSTPATYSLDAVNYLIQYMKENPSAQAELIGYADQRGSSSYNTNLSERRAKKVYDILVAAGVDGSRLSHKGNGEESSDDMKQALQLMRRVTFKLK